MIVVVILTIVALAVLPSDLSANTRLAAAARKLISDIEYAQVASIGQGEDPLAVVFDVNQQCYYLAHTSDLTTPIQHPIERIAYRTAFSSADMASPTEVQLADVNLGSDDMLVFGAHGAPQEASAGTVTLISGSSSVTVTVDPATGAASIAD